MNRLMKIVSIAGMMAVIPTVHAADDSDITLDGVFGVVTDYREKGVSLTSKDIAAIANLRLSHKSGLYFDGFAASTGNRVGDDLFADAMVGYRWDSDTYSYNVAVALKSYHGDIGSRSFAQMKATIARDFGILYISGGVEYAPEGRWNSPDVDSFYTFTDLEFPVPNFPDLTLITHVGYDMRQDRSDLFDWSAGISAFHKDMEISLTYDDSSLDHPDAKGGVFLGAKLYF